MFVVGAAWALDTDAKASAATAAVGALGIWNVADGDDAVGAAVTNPWPINTFTSCCIWDAKAAVAVVGAIGTGSDTNGGADAAAAFPWPINTSASCCIWAASCLATACCLARASSRSRSLRSSSSSCSWRITCAARSCSSCNLCRFASERLRLFSLLFSAATRLLSSSSICLRSSSARSTATGFKREPQRWFTGRPRHASQMGSPGVSLTAVSFAICLRTEPSPLDQLSLLIIIAFSLGLTVSFSSPSNLFPTPALLLPLFFLMLLGLVTLTVLPFVNTSFVTVSKSSVLASSRP
mmetsp:Transcript_23360/g.67323  ORF Transcript_23360/g.67323 Transcript_23360/m.67323 type:complete len:295 (-) Transcript_23360:3310-4194(-)